jgi:hypothetical protein
MTPQKTPKQKEFFMGFPGTFARSKSQWIGFDADENGQSRQHSTKFRSTL